MKIINSLINTNIYISLAAVFLTVEAQIQLGLKPQWHPYLFIIFFATLFEYNLHRLVTVLTNKEAFNSEKYLWVRENQLLFYILVFISVAGFAVVAMMAKREVIITFTPIAIVTLFYSIPISNKREQLPRLREIPFLKIFLIAAVWSASTILLPIVQSANSFNRTHVALMLIERFFFIFAIAIPFDIRDLEADKHSGLRTLPMLLNEKRALGLSYLSLLIFFLISCFHYRIRNENFIIPAICISAISTFAFLKLNYFRKMTHYHYGILDGTMLLQGILVLISYCFTYS